VDAAADLTAALTGVFARLAGTVTARLTQVAAGADDPELLAAAEVVAAFDPAVTDAVADAVVDAASNTSVAYGFDVADQAAADAVATHLGMVDRWAADLASQVASEVAAGLAAGRSSQDIADDLASKGVLSQARAEAAAITEANAAGNAGTLASIKSVAAEVGFAGKQWLSAKDMRVRPDHRHMNGTTVPLDADFIVGGFPAPYPGHPSLPPEQRIRCRCVILIRDDDGSAPGGHEDALRSTAADLGVPGASSAPTDRLRGKVRARRCEGGGTAAVVAAASMPAGSCGDRLDELSRVRLLELARTRRVAGRAKMSRPQLLEALASPARSWSDFDDDAARALAGFGSKKQATAARRLARAQAKSLPQPSDDRVAKALADGEAYRQAQRAGLNPKKVRKIGKSVDRKTRRRNTFNAYGGDVNGYASCPYCGKRVHHLPPGDPGNPHGYEKFEEDKLLDELQGGGYTAMNIVPACFDCNRGRNRRKHPFGNPKWGDPTKNAARVAKATGLPYDPKLSRVTFGSARSLPPVRSALWTRFSTPAPTTLPPPAESVLACGPEPRLPAGLTPWSSMRTGRRSTRRRSTRGWKASSLPFASTVSPTGSGPSPAELSTRPPPNGSLPESTVEAGHRPPGPSGP